jgi:hypothetical protein
MRALFTAFLTMLIVAPLSLSAGLPDSASNPKGHTRPEKGDISALIDRLVDTAEPDLGYSSTASGVPAFSPIESEGRPGPLLLFQRPMVPSGALREIVKQGVPALPQLLAHLGDQRRTKIRVSHDGVLGFMSVHDPDDKLKLETRAHTVTVGDLCYVAVGQIVNERYTAVQYFPSMNIFINSPTRSTSLRKEVEQQWKLLTPEKHKKLLTEALLNHLDVDACKRLAYYYPESLEPIALQLMARPTYDPWIVWGFVKDGLYKAKDLGQAWVLLEAFVKKHGEAHRDGIVRQLFEDLAELEATERRKNLPPAWTAQPRPLLTNLFGFDKKVRSQDRPKRRAALSDVELRELLEAGLSYDDSAKVDEAVRRILASVRDDYIAVACMSRLVGRGFDKEFERYCRRRPADKKTDEMIEEMRGRLGWTRLHVAVERKQRDRVQEWIAAGKPLDTQGRSGDAALHLAVKTGDYEIVRLLLEAKASLDLRNRAGLTPVQVAVRDGHIVIARELLKHGCAAPDVLVAALAGRVDALRALLEKDKAGLKQSTGEGLTALHLASLAAMPRLLSSC